MTEESRAKMSIARMGNTNCLGSHASEETKAKMSAARKGKPKSLEMRAKLSTTNMGHAVSPETGAKIAAANRGRVVSPETRAKQSASQMGHPAYPACIAAHLGYKRDPKTLANMSGELSTLWKGGPRMSDARKTAQRRILGFIPMNSPFPDSEGHHLDNDHVLYILRELHQKNKHNVFTGKNIEKINTLAVQWWMSQVMRTGHTLSVGEQS